MCQGGDSNSRPRAYESPALPLSYPGVCVVGKAIEFSCTTNPERFRDCSATELPWQQEGNFSSTD